MLVVLKFEVAEVLKVFLTLGLKDGAIWRGFKIRLFTVLKVEEITRRF